MKRRSEAALQRWLESVDRKPLVVRGARQVGKTWLVRRLAKDQGRQLVELNFERRPQLRSFFEGNDPRDTVRGLEQFFSKRIRTSEALLFLDEIQAAPDLLAKLRWFAEELPELPTVAAGSLLDFALKEHTFSMPVGRISYHHLEPMSFEEFLEALEEGPLVAGLCQFGPEQPPAPPVHDKLIQRFRQYRMVGGMPAAVASFVKSGSLVAVGQVQQDLVATLRDDFHKYSGRMAPARIDAVLQRIPPQVGRKFKYSHVDRDVPAASLRRALDLLVLARVAHRVRATAANALPLAAEVKERIFKVILLDTGLLAGMLGLTGQLASSVEQATAIEGALSEQVVGQLLRVVEPPYQQPQLYYWQRDQRGSEAELDYVMAHAGRIIPIEVKAGKTGALRSLHSFVRTKGHRAAVRVNADQLSMTAVDVGLSDGHRAAYSLLSIPFYLIEQLPRLLAR